MSPWTAGAALAHEPGVSQASVDATSLTLTFSRAELAALVPMRDVDAARVLLAEGVLGKVEVSFGGQACALDDPHVTLVEDDGVRIHAPLRCPTAGEGRYAADFFADLRPGHTQLVQAFGRSVGALDADDASVAFTGASDRGEVARRFGEQGVAHIWEGWDHLAFLLALLLAASRLRAMLLIVTGFTVAHSITLTLAALGHVTLPSRLIEPAIAATIVFVGVENLWRPGTRRRVATTFALGLVHGFGFAGQLAAIGLPPDALAVALASFNAGVEVGQAAVVAVAMPLLLVLRRLVWWERWAVPGGSAFVAACGVGWLVERLLAG